MKKKIKLSDEIKGQLAYGLLYAVYCLLILGTYILIGIFGK